MICRDFYGAYPPWSNGASLFGPGPWAITLHPVAQPATAHCVANRSRVPRGSCRTKAPCSSPGVTRVPSGASGNRGRGLHVETGHHRGSIGRCCTVCRTGRATRIMPPWTSSCSMVEAGSSSTVTCCSPGWKCPQVRTGCSEGALAERGDVESRRLRAVGRGRPELSLSRPGMKVPSQSVAGPMQCSPVSPAPYRRGDHPYPALRTANSGS